jgi:hypothetical protein
MSVNNAMIYPSNRNLRSIYLGRCGDNWVREDAEICLPPPGDTSRHEAPCYCMLEAAQQE